MSKIKIEIQKPQYLAAKESIAKVDREARGGETPFFFRLMMVATFMLSGLAIWYAYQRYSVHS